MSPAQRLVQPCQDLGAQSQAWLPSLEPAVESGGSPSVHTMGIRGTEQREGREQEAEDGRQAILEGAQDCGLRSQAGLR